MFFYRLCRADTETKSQYNHSVFLFYSEFYLPVASHQRKQTTKNGAGYTNWLSTYYIYDDLNNLRCVIQPEGVKAIVSTWSLTSTLLDEQCFRYEYDERGRMVMKKVPGAGEVWMVYDTRDRLVLTSDAKLRANGQWLYSLYENNLNRPTSTGLWTNSQSRVYHQGQAATSTAYPNLSGQTYDELTVTFYENYSWRSSYSNPLSDTYNTSYDTYFLSGSSFPYPQSNAQSSQLNGLVTGTRIKILGSSTYLYTVIFYDAKGRVIQVQSTNLSGGTDIVTTQYTWAGQPLIIVQKQQKSGSGSQTNVVVTKLTYDDVGKLVKTEKKVSNTDISSGAMSSYKTIAENEYDKLGQLKKKKLAPAYNSNAGLESLTYDYNIRGWMLGMNREYAKDANSTNYFGFDLGYDKAANGLINSQNYSNPQYNGNIEGMVWKSKGDGEKRKYDFIYDAANRLLKADFNQYTGGTFNQTAGVNFTMKMGDGTGSNSYDDNGNIKQMQQWGLKITGSAQIDNLAYLYQTNSNMLARVTDSNNDANTKLGDFKDGSNSGSDDYSYDANGNLNLDNNKAISSITYNHLNLPLIVTVTGKGTINYTYDAAGNKLKKVTTEGSAVTTTLYLGGAVYKNDTLQFLGQEEGRIRFKPQAGAVAASLQYDYMLKDHLGNVRMVLTEELQQDKYPVASLETSKLNTEDDYYTIDQSKIVDASTVTGLPTYTNDNGIGNNPADATFEAANSQKLYKLNSSSNKTGLGMTLKVMAGDKLDIFGKSYYFQNNTGGSSANSAVPVLDILSGMVGSANGAVPAAGHGDVTGSTLNGLSTTTTGISGLLSDQTSESANSPQVPKAYINYLFFDEQFKYVSGGFSKVGTNSAIKNHYSELQNLTASKNGYIYIYVSNESPVNVFFDNLQVVHTRSPILEETHYYPFGLTMAGISSRAAGKLQNKIGITGKEMQNKEFSDGSGLEQYDFGARFYDPQIGRWQSPDPLADKWNNYSPFNYTLNNPINYVDPDGQDVKISAQQDKDGNWTITLSSTIYVKGHGASDRVGEYNKFLKDNTGLLKNTTKNEDGTTTSINLDFKYELATDEDIARVKDDKTRNGDNFLELENSEYRSASGGYRKDIYSKDKNPATGKWDKLGTEHFTDFKAKMGNSDKPDGRYYGSAPTAFHEVMHLFGLKDWYNSAEDKKAVGPNDMMNNSQSKQPIMHQTHWNSWGQDIKTLQQQQGNNFISNHFVE